ncbi:MAG: hypothetical protein JWR77_1907 [Rhizorhabdus sp.]|nr:hypothetical protein [Rhizorhabdus sp.]
MSDLWAPEMLSNAARVDTWSRPTATTGFTPWSGDGHPLRRASDHAAFRPREAAAAQPNFDEPVVDLEQLQAEAFAAGFDQGRETVLAELAGERAALAHLIRAAEVLQPESPGALASILAETVARLVRQVVGEVTIDGETLLIRAQAIAELVTAEASPSRLRLHPDDIALLAGHDLGVAMHADVHLSRGTIMLETAEGWIEDGPQVRLARLRTQLDAMGLPR